MLPVDPLLDGVDVLVDAVHDTELRASLHATSAPQNYLPHTELQRAAVPVPAGRSWVHLPLAWSPEHAQNAVVVLDAEESLSLHRGAHVEPGTVTMIHRELPEAEKYTEQWRHWKETLHGHGICFAASPATDAFRPAQVRGGYARPYGGPNMWVSGPVAVDPQPWIELTWQAPQQVRRVDVLFDDDLNEDLINLHHHRTEHEVMPTLVRNARLETSGADGPQVLARVEENRQRRWSVEFEEAVRLEELRLVVEDLHASARGRVIGVRVYCG